MPQGCFSVDFQKALSSSNAKLLKTGEFSDFSITTSDGHEFKVHRSVLTAHCGFFASVFRLDLAEKAKNNVTLEEDALTAFMLLLWIYSGAFAFEVENAKILDDAAPTFINKSQCSKPSAMLELLIAADKYMIAELANNTTTRLRAQLDPTPWGRADLLDLLRDAYDLSPPEKLRMNILYVVHRKILDLDTGNEHELETIMAGYPQIAIDMLRLSQLARIRYVCGSCQNQSTARKMKCYCGFQGYCQSSCEDMSNSGMFCETCRQLCIVITEPKLKLWIDGTWKTAEMWSGKLREKWSQNNDGW